MAWRNLLNVAVFIAAVSTGFVAWNGKTISEVSAEHPTLLTPVGWAFSIWGVIYSSVAAFLIWQLLPKNRNNSFVLALTLPFVFACVAQTLWAPAWCSELLALAFVLMLNILYHLFILSCKLSSAPTLLRLPFSLWFGWITLATLISATTVLTDVLQLSFFASVSWALIAEMIAIAVAFAWGSLTCDPAYPAAIAWGLFGIAQNQPLDTAVARIGLIGSVFLVLHIGMVLIRLLGHKKESIEELGAGQKDEECHAEEMIDLTPSAPPSGEIQYSVFTPQPSTVGAQPVYAQVPQYPYQPYYYQQVYMQPFPQGSRS